MATLPVIANVFRCALNWSATGGQTATNVIHIRDESGTATAADIATELDLAAAGGMWKSVVPSASVVDLGITPLDGTSATEHFTPNTPANWVGQNGTDWLPNVSIVIKLTTGLRGRSHRGRVFLPFTAETVVSNGMHDATQTADMTTEWQDFANDLTTGPKNLSFGVASYKLGTFAIATGISCESVCATQRRRQGRLRGA